MRGYPITVLMLAIIVAGCEPEYDAPEEQPVFFEYHYENFAWGHQENGWLIDKDGVVRSYTLPENFRVPDSTAYMSADDLLFNLSQTDSTLHIINRTELDRYIRLIPGAAEGEVGETRHLAYDAGTSVLSCYLFDPDTGRYKYVFLARSGDYEQFNKAPEAEALVNWLKEFGVFWLSD